MSETKLSAAVERILKRAAIEAEASQSDTVGVTHLMIGILQEGKNVGAQLLSEKEVTVDQLRALDFRK